MRQVGGSPAAEAHFVSQRLCGGIDTFSLSDLQRSVTDQFPEIAEDLREEAARPYMQLGWLARLTQEAKGRADWPTYERCVSYVNRYFRNADPELENAIYVAFLEHLDFEGHRGPEAWQRLGADLQAAWTRITRANERRMALPRKKGRRAP